MAAIVWKHHGGILWTGPAGNKKIGWGGKCCCCEPKVLASFVTHSTNAPVWDLRPYQGNDMATPGAGWRLIETGVCLRYEFGTVDANGNLTGLPDEFRTKYAYAGYMELQIGCVQPNGSIHWPGACGHIW
jgi:hypothetical protein